MTQLTDLSSLGGKTIARAVESDAEVLYLIFADGAFLRIRSWNGIEGPSLRLEDEPTDRELADVGLITPQELDARWQAYCREQQAASKLVDRNHYERLWKMYGGKDPATLTEPPT
jgi:hypothetical protein